VRTAHEIGLASLSLKAVADRLDVSVASLYHHVAGRDELARLAAEYGTGRSKVPVDRGQHWAVWLREWAVHIHRSFLGQPELLSQYLAGALTADTTAANLDAVHAVLARAGFDVASANRAYELITSYAIGAAVTQTRPRRRLEPPPEADLPHLRRLQAHWAREALAPFEVRIETILAGIAAMRDEPWAPIAEALATARPAPRARR